MKQLHMQRYITETTIRTKFGTKTIKFVNNYSDISYGEINKEDVLLSNSFNDLILNRLYSGNSRKGRWCLIPYTDINGWYNYVKIYEKDFISCSRECQYKILNPSDIKMEQAIKELSADQFIEYMKDNGFGMEVLEYDK